MRNLIIRDINFVKVPVGEGISQRKGQITPQSKAIVPTGKEESWEEVTPIPGLNSTHNCQFKNAMSKYKRHSGSHSCNGDNTLTMQASPAGWLAHFQSNWEKVGGYKIEFSLKPHQTQNPAQLNQSCYPKKSKT